jgi:hypothetical protein
MFIASPGRIRRNHVGNPEVNSHEVGVVSYVKVSETNNKTKVSNCIIGECPGGQHPVGKRSPEVFLSSSCL